MAGLNEIKIILKAVDQASREIRAVTNSVDGLGNKVTEQDKAWANNAATVAKWTAAIAVAGVALKAVVKFTKESIDETVKYNKTVREMTQVLGLNADETSRIIQVADDWGISIEAVERELVLRALQRFNWNQTKAAEFLDISRKMLIYRMEKFNLRARHP